MKIIDDKEQAQLKKLFDTKRAKFSEQKYFSKLNESARIVKIIKAKLIKQDVETVFKELAGMLAKDMHADLTYDDLKNEYFYRAGKKDKKIFMHLAHFQPNKELTVEWFTDELWIVKNFYFKPKNKNKYTKVTYLVVAKGLEVSAGYFPKIMQRNYIKTETSRFDVQMFTLMHGLDLLKISDEAYQYKLTNMNLKISKIRNFSK